MTYAEEITAKARELAEKIAPHIEPAGTWQRAEYVEPEGWFTLKSDTGLVIDGAIDGHLRGSRLHLHGQLPQADYPVNGTRRGFSRVEYSYYGINNPVEISVSVDRSPEAIAKEINRRLLPGYKDAWNVAKDRLDDLLATEKISLEVAERLVRQHSGMYLKYIEDYRYYLGSHNSLIISVVVSGNDVTVQLANVSTTEAIASKIIEAVKDAC